MNTKKRNLYKTSEQSQMAKRRFITKFTSLSGIISSRKNLTNVWFESGLEKDFGLLLEYHPEVTEYHEQPITIEYYINDKLRTYTPDFLVYFKNKESKPWLCEIKYRDDLSINFSKYKNKFKAAKQYCAQNGWEFKIIHDLNIRNSLLENLKFLSKYEVEYLDRTCFKLVLDRVNDLGVTTPKEVILSISDANPSIQSKCIYALWYAIRTSAVEFDFSKPLTIDSEIWKQ